MPTFSTAAAAIVRSDVVRTVTTRDVYPHARPVIASGWVIEDGAVLLTDLKDSYFGERSRFATVSDYERAVNGRGIPDLDLEASGRDRIEPLLKRGIAFAWEALYAANQSLPTVPLAGLVSVAPIVMDPDEFTGNVTFVSAKSHTDFDRGFDSDQAGVLIMLTSAECLDPLPDSVV